MKSWQQLFAILIRSSVLALGVFVVLTLLGFAAYWKHYDVDYLRDARFDVALGAAWADYFWWYTDTKDKGVSMAMLAGFVALILAGANALRLMREAAPRPRAPVAPEVAHLSERLAASGGMFASLPAEHREFLAEGILKADEEGRARRAPMFAALESDTVSLDPIRAELEGDPRLAAAVRSVSRNAVLLRRLFPRDFTRTSRTFFGGLPLVQGDFTWPSYRTKSGNRAAHNFVAQIDLAEVPVCTVTRLLPREGTLYFFLPPLAVTDFFPEGDLSLGTVLYRAPATGPWTQARPPEFIAPYVTAFPGPLQSTTLQENAIPGLRRRTVYPRCDVEMHLAPQTDTDFPFGKLADLEAYSGTGPDAEARREKVMTLAAELERRAVAAIYPEPPAEVPHYSRAEHRDTVWRPTPDFPGLWLHIDTMVGRFLNEVVHSRRRLFEIRTKLEEGLKVKVRDSYARAPAVAAMRARIPARKAHVEEMRRKAEEARNGSPGERAQAEKDYRAVAAGFENFLEQIRRIDAGQKGATHEVQEADASWLPSILEDLARHESLIAAAEAWLRRIKGTRLDLAPQPAEREEFWRWWSALAEADIWFHGSGRFTGAAQPSHLNPITFDTVISVAESSLAFSPETARRVAPETVEWLRPRHLYRPGRNAHGRHQMFGFPLSVQSAGHDLGTDRFLLLQLEWDKTIDWDFGDGGAFQFWITAEALANRRFDQVKLTFEGH